MFFFFFKVDFCFWSLLKLIKWVWICSLMWGAGSVLFLHVHVQVNLARFPSLPCKVVGNLPATSSGHSRKLRVLYLLENLRKGLWSCAEVVHWKACGFGATIYMSIWAMGSFIPPGPEGPGFWPRLHIGSPAWHRAPSSTGTESYF